MRIVPQNDVPYPRMENKNLFVMSQTMVRYLAKGTC